MFVCVREKKCFSHRGFASYNLPILSHFLPAKVLSWGYGNEGALGFTDLAPSGVQQQLLQLKPRQLTSLDSEEIKVVHAGHSHSAAITKDGR